MCLSALPKCPSAEAVSVRATARCTLSSSALVLPSPSTEAERAPARLLALRYHPDSAAKHGIEAQEAEEKFLAIQAAYEVLNEPIRRIQYDRELRLQQQREWRRAGIGGTLRIGWQANASSLETGTADGRHVAGATPGEAWDEVWPSPEGELADAPQAAAAAEAAGARPAAGAASSADETVVSLEHANHGCSQCSSH